MKKEIRYVRLDPTGNLTCLVLDPVEKEDRPAVTEALMAQCEQVGYLMPPTDPKAAARLEMMGGEFCGNASMATAVYLTANQKVDTTSATEPGADGEREILLEVSGAEGLVRCAVSQDENGWRGAVEMPMPTHMEACEVMGRPLDAVFMPGIVHLVYTGGLLAKSDAESMMSEAKHQFSDQPAIGLLQYDETEGRMTPLVWVRESDTQVWETACGSGTTAVAYRAFSSDSGLAELKVTQPGGTLIAKKGDREPSPVSFLENEQEAPLKVLQIILSGVVRIGKEKTLMLS